MSDLTVKSFKLQPGELFLTTVEYEARYKISRPTQCRHRKDGCGPPFVVHNGKVLYPESGILAWLSLRLVNSTAELSLEKRGNRYAHLPASREKALLNRRNKSLNSAVPSGD